MRIDGLHHRHSGLTQALAEAFFEAASVCFARHHRSPVQLEIGRQVGVAFSIEFALPDPTILKAWANRTDTTEAGAYGVCLAALEATDNLVAVRRAETHTGADWYLAPAGQEPADLEDCFRLEVSGIDIGTRNMLENRLRKKMQKARKGQSNLPAIASVVGFAALIVLIQRLED